MNRAVGIDLGTTNSVVAYINEVGAPEAINTRSGSPITPSVVWFDADQDRTVVGAVAKEMQEFGDPAVTAFFKRMIGDSDYRFVLQDESERSAIELSACVLRQLKADAELFLKHPVVDAVVTVPAFFKDPHRKATKEAARQAGLNVLQLINEPTAAAIAYDAASSQVSDSAKDQLIIVYDLGGGTFDLSLLKRTAKGLSVITSKGRPELGGKDWDARVVDALVSQFLDEFDSDPYENPDSLGDIWIAAEQAKCDLSDRESTRVTLTHDGYKGSFELTRDGMAELCADLVERTIETVKEVLTEQSLDVDSIDEVLMVGGATRMPMVQDALQKFFGKAPKLAGNPDLVVALGAAICAHAHQHGNPNTDDELKFGDRVVDDVTQHSLGMIAINEDSSAFVNSIILPRNLSVPRRETRPYQHQTRLGEENPLEVFMTQGESLDPQKVTYLGRYVVQRVPHESGGTNVISIDYAYNRSGSVEVTARSGEQDLEVLVETLPQDVPRRFRGAPPSRAVDHATVYLSFDLSYSMAGSPLDEAKRAARAFVSQIDLSNCSLGINVVADETKTVLDACQDATQIEQAIDSLKIGMVGVGNDGHPFDELLTKLKSVKGRRFVVALADGVWTNQTAAASKADVLHGANIDVIAIGFGTADKRFLDKIASSDATSLFTSLSELTKTFSTIAREITNSKGFAG